MVASSSKKESKQSVASNLAIKFLGSVIENEVIKNNNKLTEIENFKKEVDLNLLKEKRDYLKKKSERISTLGEGLELIHKAVKVQDFSVDEMSFESKLQNYTECKQLKVDLQKLKELHGLGKTLKELEYPKPKDLSEYRELKELSHTCHALKEFKGLEAPVASFENKLQEYEELLSYSSSLKGLKEQIKSKKEQLKTVEELVQSKENKLKEFKVCPLCHKPLD